MRRVLLSTTVLLVAFTANAQKILNVSGEYIYYPTETQSYEDAKREAVYRAKMQILADTYGTVLDAGTTTVLENDADKSNVSQFSLSESHVKGEWIETVGEPEISRFLTDDMFAIKVVISGKVRELLSSGVDYTAMTLRNGTEKRFADLDFVSGDDMYMHFVSPVDGFLAIYLYDGKDEVYRLLPYSNQNVGVIKVKADVEYCFFSSEKSIIVKSDMVDEYVLTCSETMEINRIYTVFSPNEFTRAVDLPSGKELIPRMLGYYDFQKWLSRARSYDSAMTVKTMDITIKKNLIYEE